MVTLEEAKSHPIVVGNASSGARVFGKAIQEKFLYRLSVPLFSFKVGEKIGVITRTYPVKDGNNIGIIQLIKPITKGLVKYSHVFVLLNDISVSGEKPLQVGQLYYCTATRVNIRKGANITSGTLGIQLDKGDPIGYSDGVAVNGFLKFNLKTGGIGYVSKIYCTLQEPFVNEVTKNVTVANPLTGINETEKVPVIPELSPTTDWKKTAIGAAISAVVVFGVTQIIQKIWK